MKIMALIGVVIVSRVAMGELVSTNEHADVAFGYSSNWNRTHDLVRQAVIGHCGLSYKRLVKDEINDDTLKGVSLYVERCDLSNLSTVAQTALMRFKAEGGKVFPLAADGGRDVGMMLRYLESNFPQFKEKLKRGHDFIAAVDADNREARKEFKSVMLAGGPDEIRGISCHSAYGPRGEPYGHDPKWQDWDLNCARLKNWGFNMLNVNVCHAGCAFYHSSVVPESMEVSRRGDALQKLLAACRKHGLKFSAWRVCLRRHRESSREFDKWILNGRGAVDVKGRMSPSILCPNDPKNRQYEIDAFVELAQKGVWGVSLDYIRYDNEDFCFCERCRKLFARRVGEMALNDWPRCAAKGGALNSEWERFRRETITSLVRAIRDAVKGAVPTCKIGASVATPDWKDSVAQEWETWCKEGLLDIVGPMNYYAAGYPRIE